MGIDAAVNPDALHSSVLSSSVAAHIHAGKSQEGAGQTAALYTVPPLFFSCTYICCNTATKIASPTSLPANIIEC